MPGVSDKVNYTGVDQAVTNDDKHALYNTGADEMWVYTTRLIKIVRGKTQRQQSLVAKCGPMPLSRV